MYVDAHQISHRLAPVSHFPLSRSNAREILEFTYTATIIPADYSLLFSRRPLDSDHESLILTIFIPLIVVRESFSSIYYTIPFIYIFIYLYIPIPLLHHYVHYIPKFFLSLNYLFFF